MKGKMEKVWGHRGERENESASCSACNVLFNMAPSEECRCLIESFSENTLRSALFDETI